MEEETHIDFTSLELYPHMLADENSRHEVAKLVLEVSAEGLNCLNEKENTALQETYLKLETVDLWEKVSVAPSEGLEAEDFLQVEGQGTQIKQDSFLWLPGLRGSAGVSEIPVVQGGKICLKRCAPEDGDTDEKKRPRLPSVKLEEGNYYTRDCGQERVQGLALVETGFAVPSFNDPNVSSPTENRTACSFAYLSPLPTQAESTQFGFSSEPHMGRPSKPGPVVPQEEADRLVPEIPGPGAPSSGEVVRPLNEGVSGGCAFSSVQRFGTGESDDQVVAEWLPEE